MSRLSRYRDSLNRFIKDRSCIFNKNNLPDKNVESLLYDQIKNSDLILPILLLTIMNNQNKKNNVTLQGYYMASCIEFLNVYLNITSNKNMFIEKYGIDNYNKIINYLVMSANKSLYKNLEVVKRNIDSDKAVNIFINCLNIYSEKMSHSYVCYDFDNYKTESSSKSKDRQDVIKWYLKNDIDLIKKFKTIEPLSKTSFDEYMNKKVNGITELSMYLGWIIGCGDLKTIKKLKNITKYFSYIYKISLDFHNIKKDISEYNDHSTNFIINFGLLEAYDTFLTNKQKFIQEAIQLDIFTNTIKEIINFIENRVDKIVDQTSPDLKSNYSNITSVSTL